MNLEKFVVMTSALLFCQCAFAGSVSGGGGKSVVCRSNSGAVKSVELLDLWEAKTIYGRKLLSSQAPLNKQVEAALDRIKDAVPTNDVRFNAPPQVPLAGADAFRELLKFDTDRLQMRNLPQIHWLKGVRLKLSEDSFETATPQDCAIEQTIRYDDTSTGGEVYINQDLYDRMDATNRAALLVHEAFYAHLRHLGEQSSLRVRRTIGLVFSNHHFKSLYSVLPDDFYICEGGRNKIVFYYSDIPFGRNIVSQILMADGRIGIDFDTPTEGWGFKSFNDFFNSLSIGNYTNLGRTTSIDYSLNWRTDLSAQPAKTLKLQVTSTPDQSGSSPEAVLLCLPTTKAEFFQRK